MIGVNNQENYIKSWIGKIDTLRPDFYDIRLMAWDYCSSAGYDLPQIEKII